MDATLKAFKNALVAHKVVNRVLANETPVAMEFPSEDARKKYLQQHPKANPSNHSVRDPAAPKKPSQKEQGHAADAAHQKSEEYKTGKSNDYYPQKMPEGMELPKEVKGLPKEIQDLVAAMPDEDLEKDAAYRNKAIKDVQKKVLSQLEAGDESGVTKTFQDLSHMKSDLFDRFMAAKTDADADPYRFATRKVNHVWRGYNAALQEHNAPPAPPRPKAAPAPKPSAAPDHIIDTDIDDHDSYHKTEDYKTKKNRSYYPQKAPPGLKEPEEVKTVKKELSPEQVSWMEDMPDEDLDKGDAYDHPKITAVSDALLAKVKKGEMTRQDIGKAMGKLQDAKSGINDKFMDAKTDAEADEYRFPMRQLYKVWQGYNKALQSSGSSKEASAVDAFKDAVIARKVAARMMADRG